MPDDRRYTHSGSYADPAEYLYEMGTTNLLVDGDMEAVDMAAWTIIPGTSGATKEASPVYAGSLSTGVFVLFSAAAGYYGVSQSVMAPGATYRLRGWAYRPAGASDPDAQQIRTGAGTILWISAGVPDVWEEIDVTFTADHDTISLGYLFPAFGFGGFVYYDDFSLVKRSTRLNPSPGGGYPRVQDNRSRVLRLVAMHKGSWSANPALGMDWAQLDKYADDVAPRAERLLAMALDPLVREGAISEVSARVTHVWDGGIGFELDYLDLASGERPTLSQRAPWVR